MRFWIYLTAISLMIFPGFARAAMEDYPSVKLQGLDKSTARTTTFEAKVGSTITYGRLFIRIQSCRKAPPIEKPESAAFLQIWEVPPETGKSEWIFSGWMFASSPALSAMDHPVYDIWVLDCSGREEPNEEAAQSESDATVESQDELAPPTAEGTAEEPAAQDAAPAAEEVIDSEAQSDDYPSVADESAPLPDGTPPGGQVYPSEPYPASPVPGAAPAPTPAPTPAPAVDYDAPYSPSQGYPAQTPYQGQ